MKTITASAANRLGKFLTRDFRRMFGPAHNDVAERLGALARSTIECLGRSDALYHNFEHTYLVTMVGRDILQGMALAQRIEPADYDHLIVACLLHDIGYMRGVLSGDTETEFVVDASGRKVTLPRGSSDAALTPYHVDRSKLYVLRRIAGIAPLDPQRIADAIEGTRFPPAPGLQCDEEASIVRAADFIGQLGDPNYIRKANALYHEFEEVGINRQLGYDSPADIINRYPQFYWDSVAPQIQTEIGYLNMTSVGRQWIANLYANVFRAERDIALSGPQQ